MSFGTPENRESQGEVKVRREWLGAESAAEPIHPGTPPAAALYDLRPLSLGEVLDRTFSLYRSRFWLFAGITAVSASVQVVVQAISLATSHRMMRQLATAPRSTPPAFNLHQMLSTQISTWIAALVFVLVAAIANAATTLALGEVYLDRPASAKAALLIAFKRWYRWIGIGLWQAGSLLWIFAAAMAVSLLLIGYGARVHNTALTVIGGIVAVLGVLGGFPAGVVLYLRNCLAIPAAMMEKLTIRQAMRRSKGLAAGTKGRIFVVLLITGVLYLVVGVLESPASIFMIMAPKQQHYLAQAVTLVISFLGHMVVAPVGLIGLTLLYFDQRVRKEAFDLQLLLENSRPATGAGDLTDLTDLTDHTAVPAPPQGSTSLG